VSFRDPKLAQIIPFVDHAFGKWKSDKQVAGLQKNRMHLTIGGDDDIFWLSDRRGHVIRLERDELFELLSILNNRMPLEALANI
jgi:hypothetical protein